MHDFLGFFGWYSSVLFSADEAEMFKFVDQKDEIDIVSFRKGWESNLPTYSES